MFKHTAFFEKLLFLSGAEKIKAYFMLCLSCKNYPETNFKKRSGFD